MTDALVSSVVKELGAKIKDEVRLLAGVKKELNSLSSTFSAIQAVLVDAERKQVTTEGLRDWLGKIKEVAYEAEDILDEWRTDTFTSEHDEDEDDIGKILTICFSLFPCLCFKQVKLRHDIGHRIREVRQRLDEISEEKSNFNLQEVNMGEGMLRPTKEELETGSLIIESEIFGRDEVKERIISQLVNETGQKEKPISVVSIVGMGGLGKTTLARLVYNDARVEAYFQKRIWVCVSNPFDVKRIATEVIERMDRSVSNNASWDVLQRNLGEALSQKKFLLVLDDVWNEDYALWEKLKAPLMGAAQGSKVVVTTRIHQVAAEMETPGINVHELGVLSHSDCWKLFHSRALEGTEEENCWELTEIGEKIVERCKGVPLAVKAVGSLLRITRAKQYWERVFDSEIWGRDTSKDDILKNGILPSLLLSYDNLPSRLKRCFSFCSVFPKGHGIEKDELVKLWMAHGIITSEKAKKGVTEETDGEMYFDYLLKRSLFQEAKKDKYGNIVRCKMHDLVHDLATFVSSGEYCSMEAGDSELSSIKCHHLSLLLNSGMSSIPSPLCSTESLRTLLLFNVSTIKEVPESLFNHLKFLRALLLRGHNIENLPSSLGKLKHLRYLDLSGMKITELPESVTDLCNLQTLKLNKCKNLHSLPSGMNKMVKLRHLEIEETNNLTVLPNGLGKMTSLRTLSKFPVGDENGGCKIGELKELNLLRGKLSINNLERVMKVNDASEAELHKKSGLQVLSLCCNDKSDEEWRMLGDDEMKRMKSVLEGLGPPHSNLKELKIKNYAGSMFPSWLDSEGSRFSSGEVMPSLEKLKIIYCKKLKAMPNCLPSTLRAVTIKNCNEVIWAQDNPLPHLSHLTLINVRGMESKALSYLTALKTLYMKGCSRESLPSDGWGQLKALQDLKIYNCERLSSLPEGIGQLKAHQTLKIYDCKLSSLPEGPGQLQALQTLEIYHCTLSSLPEGLEQLEDVLHFEIYGCEQLSSLLGQLKALQTLIIFACKLSSLPKGLGQLKAVQNLEIFDCELSSLPEELGQLKALQTLKIFDCQRLSSLPEGLGQLKALQTLIIFNCKRLSYLPVRLGQLKALQTLQIFDCKRLSYLPEDLGQLKALQTLEIFDCK